MKKKVFLLLTCCGLLTSCGNIQTQENAPIFETRTDGAQEVFGLGEEAKNNPVKRKLATDEIVAPIMGVQHKEDDDTHVSIRFVAQVASIENVDISWSAAFFNSDGTKYTAMPYQTGIEVTKAFTRINDDGNLTAPNDGYSYFVTYAVTGIPHASGWFINASLTLAGTETTLNSDWLSVQISSEGSVVSESFAVNEDLSYTFEDNNTNVGGVSASVTSYSGNADTVNIPNFAMSDDYSKFYPVRAVKANAFPANTSVRTINIDGDSIYFEEGSLNTNPEFSDEYYVSGWYNDTNYENKFSGTGAVSNSLYGKYEENYDFGATGYRLVGTFGDGINTHDWKFDSSIAGNTPTGSNVAEFLNVELEAGDQFKVANYGTDWYGYGNYIEDANPNIYGYSNDKNLHVYNSGTYNIFVYEDGNDIRISIVTVEVERKQFSVSWSVDWVFNEDAVVFAWAWGSKETPSDNWYACTKVDNTSVTFNAPADITGFKLVRCIKGTTTPDRNEHGANPGRIYNETNGDTNVNQPNPGLSYTVTW